MKTTIEKPENITLWEYPSHYMGEDFSDYYDVIYRNRDSRVLEQSNFECFLEAIGGESDTVKIIRASHWAVGWIEFIAVHKDDHVAIEKADRLAGSILDYPVLNDEHFSQMENDEVDNIWRNCYSLKDRIELCAECGISIFAARSESFPHYADGTGSMFSMLSCDI